MARMQCEFLDSGLARSIFYASKMQAATICGRSKFPLPVMPWLPLDRKNNLSGSKKDRIWNALQHPRSYLRKFACLQAIRDMQLLLPIMGTSVYAKRPTQSAHEP